jgi:actin-related protein 10
VLKIYGSRPLYTSIRSTPLAGARLSAHLRSLLLLFGSYLPPMGVVGSAPKATSVPEDVLTDTVVEEVKTRCCFVGEPIHSSKNRPRSSSSSTVAADDAVSVDTSGDSAPSESGHSRVSVEVDNPSDSASTTYPGRQLSVMRDLYVRHSSATDLRLAVPVPGAVPSGAGTSTTIRATLIIPGWVRERAAEVLFEDGDLDETSVAEVILDALLKARSSSFVRMWPS